MQNAGPDSPRPPSCLALAGLVLILLAPASPAAADDTPRFGREALPGPTRPEDARPSRPERSSVWPMIVRFGNRAGAGGNDLAPVGLAFRLSHGLSVGAVAGVDPGRGGALGLIALELKF